MVGIPAATFAKRRRVNFMKSERPAVNKGLQASHKWILPEGIPLLLEIHPTEKPKGSWQEKM